MEPSVCTLRIFRPYLCRFSERLWIRMKRYSTTGNRGGSVESVANSLMRHNHRTQQRHFKNSGATHYSLTLSVHLYLMYSSYISYLFVHELVFRKKNQKVHINEECALPCSRFSDFA